jgi:hypothetical protein
MEHRAMSLVIRLSAHSVIYADDVARLDPAERVLPIARRWWVADRHRGDDRLPRLYQALNVAGVRDGGLPADQLIRVVVPSARRLIDIGCSPCSHLFDDEKQVLNATSLRQTGKSDVTQRALRTALLSAHGAEFALGPLELFARAKRFLCRHAQPQMNQKRVIAVEPWLPPSTVH